MAHGDIGDIIGDRVSMGRKWPLASQFSIKFRSATESIHKIGAPMNCSIARSWSLNGLKL